MNATLFDTHCHLDFEAFGQELLEVVARAEEAGVSRMTTIGSGRDVQSAQAALDIAAQFPEKIFASVGIHPHDAVHATDAVLDKFAALAESPNVVAVGEVGLDYYYEHSPKEAQKDCFRKFIAVARTLKKPIVVHTRQSANDTLEMLRQEHASDVGGIIHCFSEDTAFAKAALDLGFVASFSGIVTFKNSLAIQEAARQQPADAILVETDAPFLAPVPFRGKRNEPAFVSHTARFIAQLRGQSDEEFFACSTRNACRVFGIPE